MTPRMRLVAYAVAGAAGGLFVWSLRHAPEAWMPGCLAGSLIVGVALGLAWMPEDPADDGGPEWWEEDPWL